MLSYHAMSVWQLRQRLEPLHHCSSAGTRAISTFAKEPHSKPSTVAIKSIGYDVSRLYSIATFEPTDVLVARSTPGMPIGEYLKVEVGWTFTWLP